MSGTWEPDAPADETGLEGYLRPPQLAERLGERIGPPRPIRLAAQHQEPRR